MPRGLPGWVFRATAKHSPPTPTHAFTRFELLALLGVLALLSAVGLPALARSRQPAHRSTCANNLRQLGQALLMFSAENNNLFPPRSSSTRWPVRLFEHYGDTNVLRCPADGPHPLTFGGPYAADNAPRSYIFNGFSDYFRGFPTNGSAVPERAIKLPAQTIVFGEKDTRSGHFWFDSQIFDDITELEQGRHFASTQNRTDGGSNYTFADGSVQFLKYGRSLYPTNLWAVLDDIRTIAIGP